MVWVAFQSQFGFSGLCDVPHASSIGRPARFQSQFGFSGLCDVTSTVWLTSGAVFQSQFGFSGLCDDEWPDEDKLSGPVSIPVRVFWPLRPRRCADEQVVRRVSIPVRVFWPLRLVGRLVAGNCIELFQSQFGFSGLCDSFGEYVVSEAGQFQSQFGFSGLCDLVRRSDLRMGSSRFNPSSGFLASATGLDAPTFGPQGRFNPSSGFLASATGRPPRVLPVVPVSIPVRVFWPLRQDITLLDYLAHRCFNPSSGFLASATRP